MEKPTPNEATPRSKDPLVKFGPETPTLNAVPPRKDPLFESIMDHFELHYTRGGQAYVTHKQDDRGEIIPLQSKKFSQLLHHHLYIHTGKVPQRSVVNGMVQLMEIKALEGRKVSVCTRIGSVGDSIYTDSAGEYGQHVKMSPETVEIVPARGSAAKFLSRPGSLPLVNPDLQGDLSRLFQFLNVEDPDHQKLVIAYLVMSLNPSGPYPILTVQGEQGTGKSCLCRFLRDLVDPAEPYLENFPRTEHELLISARHGHILAYDNISGVNDSMSDALCRISTGSGLRIRKLYTDIDEVRLSAKKPILLNGIADLFSRQDVCDRSITVRMARISPADRVPERELNQRWEQEKPGILGGLYRAVAMALRNLDGVQLDSYPRMADFARFIVAAEPALPWAAGDFLQAYERNRQAIIDDAIEADPVASAITRLLDYYPAGWRSSPSDLLAILNQIVSDDIRHLRTWPKMANQLSAKLNRCVTFLRARNIVIDSGHKVAGQRVISVQRLVPPQPVLSGSASAPVLDNQPIPVQSIPVQAQVPADGLQPEQPDTCWQYPSDDVQA